MTVNSEFAKSPLGGAKHGRENAVLLQEVPFTPAFDLRAEPGSDGYNEVNLALGLVLPTVVGASATSERFTALCLGPDWWYLTGTGDIEGALAHARATTHLSLVDVSAQRTKIEIFGPHAKDVLAHYWEQDLRDDHFGEGACSQGVLAKAPVVLWHCCADCYIVFVRSSFAQHLWAALTDATVEYL